MKTIKDKSLWDLIKIKEFQTSNRGNFDINTFRTKGGFNSKLSTWDPLEKSSRYYKSLLYSFAVHLDNKIINNKNLKIQNLSKGSGINFFLKKVKNRSIGNPMTINYYNNILDIDYLLSVEEMFFLNSELKNIKSILEIGPGFGRLAHSVLSQYSNINKYYIIDLPWMLNISKIFLKKALSKKNFSKIIFISVEEYAQSIFKKKFLKKNFFDLCINIDSFQEMPKNTVFDYLRFIQKTCKKFYSKNAICKYAPSIVDIKLKDETEYQTALKMGICQNVIDIYNSNELLKQQKTYLKSFCPSGFKVKIHEQCYGQYLYYHSVLYQRK